MSESTSNGTSGPNGSASGSGGTANGEREPAYWCMHCPESFATAALANTHHEATGHHQHWLRSRSYAARQAKQAANGTPGEIQPSRDTFTRLQVTIHAAMVSVAQSCRPHGDNGRAHDVVAPPELVAVMKAVRAELQGLPAVDAQQLAERLHNLSSRAAQVHGYPASAATWLDLPSSHRQILTTAAELLLQGES